MRGEKVRKCPLVVSFGDVAPSGEKQEGKGGFLQVAPLLSESIHLKKTAGTSPP